MDNKFTIKYNILDPETKGQLKSILDHRLQYWIKKEQYIDKNVFEYLKKLFKSNQGDSITIEYDKLVSSETDDKVYEIIHKNYKETTTISQDIRGSIQRVLIDRANKLYNNMILNPGI
jgi:dihydroxyacetone kinase-like predicted kinase